MQAKPHWSPLMIILPPHLHYDRDPWVRTSMCCPDVLPMCCIKRGVLSVPLKAVHAFPMSTCLPKHLCELRMDPPDKCCMIVQELPLPLPLIGHTAVFQSLLNLPHAFCFETHGCFSRMRMLCPVPHTVSYAAYDHSYGVHLFSALAGASSVFAMSVGEKYPL